MATENPEDYRMSLGDHLEDLRYRLIMGMVGPLVAAIGLLTCGEYIVAFLCRPLLVALETRHLPTELYLGNVVSAFAIYMKISLMGGVIIGIPWLGYHIWMFVAPGLYPKERRIVKLLIPGSAALATIGVSFLYYVLLPFMLWFLIKFGMTFPMPNLAPSAIEKLTRDEIAEHTSPNDSQAPSHVVVLEKDPESHRIGDWWIIMPGNELRVNVGKSRVLSVKLTEPTMLRPLFQLDQYISFVLLLALAFAIAFQLPMVLLLLGWLGVVDAKGLASGRKYALLACAVIGAILTPPDVISMIGLAVPLYILYELGILLVRMLGKRRSAERQ